jgi:hypothetical protein
VKTYSSILDDQQIQILKGCIGKNIQIINSPGAELKYGSNYISSYDNFSILLNSDSFLIIKNFWLETEEYNDYWKLTFETSDTPEGLNYNVEDRCFVGPFFSFNLPRALVINRIEVHVKSEQIGEEQIQFDYGVIFYLEDEISLAFFPMESIADGIEMNLEKDQIKQAIRNCSIRLEIS